MQAGPTGDVTLRGQRFDDVRTHRSRSWGVNVLQLTCSVLAVFLIWACDKAASFSNQFTGAAAQPNPPSKVCRAARTDCLA